MAIVNRDDMKDVLSKSLNAIFEEEYSKIDTGHIEYRLEQCGKLYRVKKTLWGNNLRPEYKTGWLKLKEAQAILKLMEVSEDGTA